MCMCLCVVVCPGPLCRGVLASLVFHRLNHYTGYYCHYSVCFCLCVVVQVFSPP
ncbi:hypothetical protein LDENG_00226520 [Lucifuga dentata]|nr:hypothetical protein LDENG_00226520 [Lucifuga dentata]